VIFESCQSTGYRQAVAFFHTKVPRWEGARVAASLTEDREVLAQALEDLQENSGHTFSNFTVDSLAHLVRSSVSEHPTRSLIDATISAHPGSVRLTIFPVDHDEHDDPCVYELSVRPLVHETYEL